MVFFNIEHRFMANIWFLYRMYTQSKWAFYNWDSTTLPKTIDPRYAEDRRKKNEDLFETITLYLPAKEVLEVEIPIWEANDKTKEDEDFEKSILSDIRIDPKTRIICNKILIDYMYTSWGYFVKRKWNERSKMHTKNMEVLQLMKDVIMWFVRYDPIKLDYEVGKWARRKRIEHDWDIAEDLIDKTYYVWKKKYTTSIYWVYTRILRKSMFKSSTEVFDFYWQHEFQYFQRQYDLNYWAINYLCASRNLGKCIEENQNIRMYDGTFRKAKDVKMWDKLLSSDWIWFVEVIERDDFIKDCVEITLKNWMKKIVSTDHRIPTQNNYINWKRDLNIENYKKAVNLNEKDFLVTQLSVKDFSNKWDFNEWFLVWYCLWDWCRVWWKNWHKRWWCITIASHNEYLWNKLKEVIESMWFTYTEWKDWKWKIIRAVWSNELKREYDLNQYSYDKKIHSSIFWKSNVFKRWLIAWLILSDWYIWKEVWITFTSISEELCRWFMQICQDLWILAWIKSKVIRSQFNKTRNISWNVSISSIESLKKIFNNIDLTWKTNYQILKDHIFNKTIRNRDALYPIPIESFRECNVTAKRCLKSRWRQYIYWEYRSPRYDYAREKLESYELNHWWDYWWNKIKKQENVWKRNVVHLRVTWDSCYWVNWILTHNTLYGLFNTCLPMFKSLTFKNEFVDKANLKCHFFVLSQWVIENYSIKLKEFFRNLLVGTYQLSDEAANQIVKRNKAAYTMTFITWEDDRSFEFVSEWASSKRWERSSRITLDECNYLKNYEEVSEFATKSWAWTVNQISTISVGSKTSLFYKNRVDCMVKQRKAQPIDEIIHHVWTKYWFDKMKSREDYKQMVKDWVFDAARTEYYKLRNTYAMKATLDEAEHLTEEEKENRINQAIDSVTGYDGMLAEYYCELSPEKAAINYKPNIIDIENVPSRFQKIYAWYDEADTWDQATLVVWWVNDRKLYILEWYVLPKELWNRYKRMKEILDDRANKSILKPSLIVDIGRWPMYFMDTNRNVPYADMWIQARFGRFEKIESTQGVSYYSLWTQLLVEDIMNTQLIGTDKLFFSSWISPTLEIKYPDWIKEVEWLFWQLDNYVLEWKSYKGRGKKPDDLVSALLYVSYYAYVDAIKEWAILESRQVSDPIEVLDAKFESKRREMQELVKRPKKSVWSIW